MDEERKKAKKPKKKPNCWKSEPNGPLFPLAVMLRLQRAEAA